MVNLEQMSMTLNALPDPAFLLSRTGKYIAVFGGQDERYYHDGSDLVGMYISDLIEEEKSNWFLEKIAEALQSKKLLIEEYELGNKDVKGLKELGPQAPIWFEGRIQALDFIIEGEEIVLWVASNISKRHDLEIKLRKLSDTDQLTGLFNRRKLEQDMSLHFAAFSRHSTETTVVMYDIDNLKLINDGFGHHVGDQAIVEVANICQSALRKTDIACRFGGDEFIIVLPGIELEYGIQFIERLKELFKEGLQRFCADNVNITVSMGITSITSKDESHEDTLKRADCALYEAKKNGKNQIMIR